VEHNAGILVITIKRTVENTGEF